MPGPDAQERVSGGPWSQPGHPHMTTRQSPLAVLTCAMAIVRFKQGRDIEAFGLGGRDQLKQRAAAPERRVC